MSGFNMKLVNDTIQIKIDALQETFYNPEIDRHYRIEYSAPLLDGFLVVFGENEQDAKERFISFANRHDLKYGSIKSVKFQG